MALVVGGLVIAFYLYQRVDEEIRRRVEEQIAQLYPDLRVSVRAARFIEGQGIEVRDLMIFDPEHSNPRETMVHLEEVFLGCRGDWEELVTGELEISRVMVRHPTLRVQRRANGSWNIDRLLAYQRSNQQSSLPPLMIENGQIEMVDTTRSPSSTFTLRDINVTLSQPSPSDTPNRSQALPASSPCYRLRGTFGGDFLRQVQVEGYLDPSRSSWSLGGTIEALEVSPELRDTLPRPWNEKLAVLASFRGQAKLGFQIASDPTQSGGIRFEISGQVARGRIDDPRFPRPLTNLQADFQLNNGGIHIKDLTANGGRCTVWLSGTRYGFDPTSPMQLTAKIRNLKLEQALIDAARESSLPERLYKRWYEYLPSGNIHADITLTYDGQKWKPEIVTQCLGVSFTYFKFPYRLEGAKGTIRLKDDTLHTNLTAFADDREVQITGEIEHPTTGPSGWYEIKAMGIPLNEKLFQAIGQVNKRTESVVRSLHPGGNISVFLRFDRDQSSNPMTKYFLVSLNRCWMRYEKFSYSLSNISGSLEMRHGAWKFRNLKGYNGTAFVTAEGELGRRSEGSPLELRLTGENIPLEEELRAALNHPNARQLWTDLQLQGQIDLTTATVRHRAGQPGIDLTFRAVPHGDSVSIKPKHLPYRFEKLRGEMVFRAGSFRFERLKAEHGETKLSAVAACDFLPDGSWTLRLDKLFIDQLRFNRELLQALPNRMKTAVAALNPRGPMDLRGTFHLARSGRKNDPLTAGWDIQVGIHQGGFTCGVPLENISGGLSLIGRFDGRHFNSRGTLAIDSVMYRNVQLTDLKGPIWIDDQRVLFGEWADRPVLGRVIAVAAKSGKKPRPITAKLFDGTLRGDGWIVLGAKPQYVLAATLRQARLGSLARELVSGRQKLEGTLQAEVNLEGTGRELHNLGGYGKIQLRDADIYELPLMISLLKILNFREPDQTAFSKADIRFNIETGHINLSEIDFVGDAISLQGYGEMDFQSAVRMSFHAVLGRSDFQIPVIGELLGGASEQTMEINVRGTLKNPITEKVLFPGVNQAIQQIQADLQRSTSIDGIRTPRRPKISSNRERTSRM